MIQDDFQQIIGPEAIGSLRGHLRLVVETLHTSERYFSFGAKPVEHEAPVIAEHFCHLLHRLEPGAHGSCAPRIEKLACPKWGNVFPEALKVLFEQICPDGFDVIREQILKSLHLVVGQIFRTLQQAPATSCQQRFFPLGLEFLGFFRSDLVNGLAHVAHHMKPVEDVDRCGGHLGYDSQIGFPHVAADKPQILAPLLAKPFEETPECPGGSVASYPEQPSFSCVELVNQGDELLFALSPANLIGADGHDTAQVSMHKPPLDRHLHRTNDTVPTGMKYLGNLLPAQPFRPSGEEPGVGGGEVTFPLRPRQPLNLHATVRTVNPARGIEEENQNPPQRDELETPLPQSVIAGASMPAPRTDCQLAALGTKRYFQSKHSGYRAPFACIIDKTWLFLDAIQDSLYLHPVLPSLPGSFVEETSPSKVRQDAFFGTSSLNESFTHGARQQQNKGRGCSATRFLRSLRSATLTN